MGGYFDLVENHAAELFAPDLRIVVRSEERRRSSAMQQKNIHAAKLQFYFAQESLNAFVAAQIRRENADVTTRFASCTAAVFNTFASRPTNPTATPCALNVCATPSPSPSLPPSISAVRCAPYLLSSCVRRGLHLRMLRPLVVICLITPVSRAIAASSGAWQHRSGVVRAPDLRR